MVKLLSAAATLLLVKEAASVTCPQLTSSYILNDDGTFYYAIATHSGDSYLCGRIESSKGGWVGFGISEPGNTATGAGAMNGAQAVIASPDDGTVLKYDMTSGQVSEMDDAKQTLVNTEVTQEDGVTIMTFAKLLAETGENEILANGDNAFLYALGSSNNVGYHGYGPEHRAKFTLDLGFSFDESPPPSPLGTAGVGTGENEIPNPGIRTMSPTPAVVVRTSVPTSAPTPEEDPVPATQPPSSAMSRSNIGTVVVLGAGSIAAWFGMM